MRRLCKRGATSLLVWRRHHSSFRPTPDTPLHTTSVEKPAIGLRSEESEGAHGCADRARSPKGLCHSCRLDAVQL